MQHTFYLYFSAKDMLRVLWFRFKVQTKKHLGLHPQATKVFKFKDYGKMAVSICKDGDIEFEVEDDIDCECDCNREPQYNEGYD